MSMNNTNNGNNSTQNSQIVQSFGSQQQVGTTSTNMTFQQFQQNPQVPVQQQQQQFPMYTPYTMQGYIPPMDTFSSITSNNPSTTSNTTNISNSSSSSSSLSTSASSIMNPTNIGGNISSFGNTTYQGIQQPYNNTTPFYQQSQGMPPIGNFPLYGGNTNLPLYQQQFPQMGTTTNIFPMKQPPVGNLGSNLITSKYKTKMSPFEIQSFSDTLEKEPILLLDTTGSMNWGASPEKDAVSRKAVVREALGTIVSVLTKEDSQNAKESGEGGLLTVTFANGRAHELGDLNPRNIHEKFNSIKWGGGTFIVPGWKLLKKLYLEEFGNRKEDERPLMMVLIITDGEADDRQEFEEILLKDKNAYVTIAVLGYGEEHDQAVKCFNLVAKGNKRVRVIPFDSETDPNQLAQVMLKMIE